MNSAMTGLLYEQETYQIRKAAFEVYKEMNNGYLESVYQECMEKELASCSIPFESQKRLSVYYKGNSLEQKYIPDLICFGKIIVELKATKEVSDEHKAQLLNYLKATGFNAGLLINFGHYPGVEIVRMVLKESARISSEMRLYTIVFFP